MYQAECKHQAVDHLTGQVIEPHQRGLAALWIAFESYQAMKSILREHAWKLAGSFPIGIAQTRPGLCCDSKALIDKEEGAIATYCAAASQASCEAARYI